MIINHKLEIDLIRRGVTPMLDAMQNDANSRSVEISLLENGTAWEIPYGVSAAISYRKPDGTSGLYDQLPDGNHAVDIEGSKLRFFMVPQMLTVPGLVRAAVVLVRETVRLAAFPFAIHVEADPGAGASISENYYHYTTFDALNNAIGDLADLNTADKSNLVAAVNEIARNGGSGTVRSVNGIGPDASGNVEIPFSDPSGYVSIFAGKTASFYGDSLTETNYHYTKGYHAWVKEILGLASYNNYGVSGYKVADVYNKVNSVTDKADVVFVMCGVNDQGGSIPIGAFGDTTPDTIYGALDRLCGLLKQKYPTSIVVFITPAYQSKYPHSAGITSREVSGAIREVCEKYAIAVYDNFTLSGIYSTNLSTFTTDNCHWNDTGHEMVGKNLARFMMSNFQYIYGKNSGAGTHTHSYTRTVTKAATCTATGIETFTCACGDKYTQTIPAAGHRWNNGVVTVAPTETAPGVRTYTCTVCGETKTETIPAVGHKHSYVSTVIAPTCTEQGYTQYVCGCGDSYKDTYINATGHNYVDGVCSACGAVDPSHVVPKTLEITGVKNAGCFDLTFYVEDQDIPASDGSLEIGFKLTPISIANPTIEATACGAAWEMDEIGNLNAGYADLHLYQPYGTVTANQDGTYSILRTHPEVTFERKKAYCGFVVALTLGVGDKFVLSDYYVKVGSVPLKISAIGGIFAAESIVIS